MPETVNAPVPTKSPLRDVNERLFELPATGGRAEVAFYCECDRDDCVERMKVAASVFEETRRRPGARLVTPFHRSPGDEVVSDGGRYLVVLAAGSATAASPKRYLRALAGAEERASNLERALARRIVIEQAKGVLVERLRMSPEMAFEVLRRASRSYRRSIHALAAEVVATRTTPFDATLVVASLTASAGARAGLRAPAKERPPRSARADSPTARCE